MYLIGTEERPELERFDQVQHLEHRESLRRRRRLVDRHAAVGAVDRLGPAGVLRAEVALVKEAAQLLQPLGYIAAIETVAPLASNRLQRARQPGIFYLRTRRK